MVEDAIEDKIEVVERLYLSDSEVVLKQLKLQAGLFDLFTGLRVDAIQTSTEPEEWYHVASEDNSADLPTRPTATCNEVMGQKWMKSTFLHLPREEWRIRKVGTRAEDEILPGERPRMGPAVQQDRTVGINAVAVSQTISEDGERLDLWISGNTSLKQIVNYVSRLLWWRHKRVKDPNAYKKQALEALIRRDQGKVKERLLENK